MARLFLLAAVTAVIAVLSGAAAREEPRVVVLLHDGGPDSAALAYAAPVLKHLGLVVEPHSTAEALPDVAGRSDLRGVVVWLDTGEVADIGGFSSWARGVTRDGLPLVLMGALPQVDDRFGLFLALDLIYSRDERAYSYDLRPVEKESALVEIDRRFDNLFPLTDTVRPSQEAGAHPLLVLQRRSDVTDRTMPLIVTAKGGYAAAGYALWRSADRKVARWMVGPVAWFRLTLRLNAVPAPDPTTLNARRIYAPALAPASTNDEDAVVEVGGIIGAARPARPLSVLLDAAAGPGPFVPDQGRACDDGRRSTWMGYDRFLAALDADGAPHRLAPYAPVIIVCAARRQAAIDAAAAVLDHAAPLPLAASDIALEQLEEGFASIKLDRLDTGVWRVSDRGALDTLRFDDAHHLRIDWTRSEGVLGAGRVGDSLYVSLDPDIAEPKLALTNMPWEPPPFATLVESRWRIWQLTRDIENAAMQVQGYGRGDMVWSVEPNSEWELRFTPADGALRRYRAAAGADGVLAFSLPAEASGGGTLQFERKDYAEVGP